MQHVAVGWAWVIKQGAESPTGHNWAASVSKKSVTLAERKGKCLDCASFLWIEKWMEECSGEHRYKTYQASSMGENQTVFWCKTHFAKKENICQSNAGTVGAQQSMSINHNKWTQQTEKVSG